MINQGVLQNGLLTTTNKYPYWTKMKFSCFVSLFLLYTSVSMAQPVWSPQVRAERENAWMRDSLKLSPEKLKRAYDISLNYYQQLDRFSNKPKLQNKVMVKKDANMKPMLTKEQYQKYYRREKQNRQALRVKYEGTHMPM
jgi:hypothetical protein